MPATIIEIVLGVATVEVPYVPPDVERTRSVTSRVIDVGAEKIVKRILLEVPHGPAEQPRSDEKKEVRHDD